MIGAIVKYFLLGAGLGTADRFGSEYFRHGRERRQKARSAVALRYLLEHYQPASFEEDCRKPEFREAVRRARSYYRSHGPGQTQHRLERLLAKVEAGPEAPPGSMERSRRWLQREKIRPMPLRRKARFALTLVLIFDVLVLLSAGIGAGLTALLWSILEVPALLLGLMAAPSVASALSLGARSFGSGGDPDTEAKAAAETIEQTKRSLHLRLMATSSALPEDLEPPRALPPRV